MFNTSNSSILSTKKLSQPQQELVLNAGIGLTHYDILQIEKIPFTSPIEGNAVVITSKNAIHALASIPTSTPIFCVGEITAGLIHTHKVIHVALNARKLAIYITNNHPYLKVDYLCAQERRNELPDLLRDHKIELKEHIVYRSLAVKRSFDRIFAAVLFYSPRGVSAFAKANKLQPHRVVCIGETTATEAKKWFDNVLVANKPSVENTIVTTIKSLKND